MSDTINTSETAPYNPFINENKLPSALNVLTILTLIGSIMGLLGGLYNFATICKQAEQFDDLSDSPLGKSMQGLAEEAQKQAIVQCDKRMIILIITVLTSLLCIIGAIFMRKRMKMGLPLYMAGEWLYPLAFLAIGGFAGSMWMILSSFVITILFTVLYLTQRKHLNK